MKFFKPFALMPYFTARLLSTVIEPSRLKATFACPKAYREQFAHSIAQMTISVGQPVHEKERLESTVQLINRSFKACKIVVDDSIQAYTLAIASGKSSSDLLGTAIAAGDDYLARNQAIFQANFTIPYEIIRWCHWLHTPAWYQAIQGMQVAYQHNTLFRQAIDQSVQIFLARYERQNVDAPYYDRSRAEQLCIDYLLEECGVMKDIWVTLGCHYEIYPSSRNAAMAATYALFIEPLCPQFLKPVAVRFNRRNAGNILSKGAIQDETAQTFSCC